MANIIHVSPEVLRSTSNAFESTNSEIQNATSQMTQIIDSMTGVVWSGEAANAYLQKFHGLQADINKMYRMINEHVTDLQTMADTYQQSEETNISQAQSLKTDVII